MIDDATLIAKAANFIDFFSPGTYAALLPPFQVRDASRGASLLSSYQNDLKFGRMLNRPQSGLARELILDAIACATDAARLELILGYAKGSAEILGRDRAANIRRFGLILLAIRAHVIADTWAHQDFCGLASNVLNTYWDIDYDPSSSALIQSLGRQYIEYWDGTGDWKRQVLSGAEAKVHLISVNFEAVPNDTSYLGHGWMGHLPDFSFVKFRYKPCWDYPSQFIERDNPVQ